MKDLLNFFFGLVLGVLIFYIDHTNLKNDCEAKYDTHKCSSVYLPSKVVTAILEQEDE